MTERVGRGDTGMVQSRLKRQEYHTRLCCIFLILILSYTYYLVDRMPIHVAGYMVLETAAIMLTGACDIAVRPRRGLIARHLIGSLAVTAVMLAATGECLAMALVLPVTNIAYAIWLQIAKVWIRRQLGPAWTILVYDTDDSLERAQAVASRRRDLIQDSAHFEYKGDLDSLSHTMDVYRISQLLICLDDRKATEDLTGYCLEKKAVAIVCENNRLRYIMPKKIHGALKI